MKTKLVLFAFLALTFLLLSGCDLDLTNRPTETPEPSLTPTPTETPMPTATATPEPTATPKPAWQQTIETQDLQDKFFQVIDGKPVIDLYDTQTQEKIVLNQESIKITTTIDGLNPNILTALDADGNQYAFNPDFGWFKVPEVQIDPNKWQKYTDLPYNYFQEGTANIILALTYANNPTINPNAIPHYWADFSATGGGPFVYISFHNGISTRGWPWDDLVKSSWFTSKNKPFAFPGYFKTTTPDGKIIYLPGQVSNNPTQENPYQTICLFKGFDEKVFKQFTSDPSYLSKLFNEQTGIYGDLVFILAPPEKLNDNLIGWYPTQVRKYNTPNPDVAGLQKRGQLIDLFSPQDKQTILTVLTNGIKGDSHNLKAYLSMPLTSLPPELSKYILLSGFGQ